MLAVCLLARARRISSCPAPSVVARHSGASFGLQRSRTTHFSFDAGAELPARKPRDPNRKVRFNSWVSCQYVRDLASLPRERKQELWWQQEDFDSFLSTRVQIAKAYRAAAKKLGLDIAQLSSIGSYGDAGYRAMIKINSKLCNESRRGLGFGRSRQRAKNRDAYIAAVLMEQRRQRKAGGDATQLDAKAIARAARRVSERDRLYAHWLAEIYYRRDREADRRESGAGATAGAACDPASPEAGGMRTSPFSSEEHLPFVKSDSDFSGEDAGGAVQDTCAVSMLRDEDPVGAATSVQEPAAPHAPRICTKGFGLSVDRLREVGLGANGHNISRYQKLRRLGQQGTSFPDETESETVETDLAEEDCCLGDDDSAAIVAEYRRWRVGAPVRAGLPGYSEVKTYGTRRDYRAWRSWQKPPCATV